MALFFDEPAAVEELKSRGYRVVKVDFPNTVSSIRDLVEYFYSRRLFYNPNRSFPPSRNFSEDSKYLSSFVKKRQDLGLSKKEAIRETAVLIDTLFQCEKYLKLREPILNPKVLSVGFIMERVCSIASGEVDGAGEDETRRYIDEINKIYDKVYSKRDSDRAEQEMKKILRGLNNVERD